MIYKNILLHSSLSFNCNVQVQYQDQDKVQDQYQDKVRDRYQPLAAHSDNIVFFLSGFVPLFYS